MNTEMAGIFQCFLNGQKYAVQGLSGVSSDFSGTYQAANGKSYTVILNKLGSGGELTVTTYTTLANGGLLPNVQTEQGSLQQSAQSWVFAGTANGSRLEITKTNPAAMIGTIGYYGAATGATANVCPNGAFTMSMADGYGIPAKLYIGMAYLGEGGLRYAIKSLVSVGGDTVYTGAMSITNDQLQLTLPAGTLKIARTAVPGIGVPSCN